MEGASLVIVTGISGAGKSTAAKVLEDLGYFTIDNLPLSIVDKFLHISFEFSKEVSKIALVIDSRSRDSNRAFRTISFLKRRYAAKVLYIEANLDVLVKRYKETRRVHPMGANIEEAIQKEVAFLREIKGISDLILDTSGMNVHELSSRVRDYFQSEENSLIVTVQSFGFKHGLPATSDLVFDVRFLRNPHFDLMLKPKTGIDKDVQEYIQEDNRTAVFIDKLKDMMQFLLPQYVAEGKQYLTVSIGCTGGRHRSVFIAETLAAFIQECGCCQVVLRHRDIER